MALAAWFDQLTPGRHKNIVNILILFFDNILFETLSNALCIKIAADNLRKMASRVATVRIIKVLRII